MATNKQAGRQTDLSVLYVYISEKKSFFSLSYKKERNVLIVMGGFNDVYLYNVELIDFGEVCKTTITISPILFLLCSRSRTHCSFSKDAACTGASISILPEYIVSSGRHLFCFATLDSPPFCLRRSPGHGTVDVVVVLVLVLGGLLWFLIFSSTEILNEITFVDNNDVTNRANFQPVMTCFCFYIFLCVTTPSQK